MSQFILDPTSLYHSTDVSYLQHLGQGANQAFEDVDTLVTLLDKYNPSAASPSTKTLGTLLDEMEAERIPKSSASGKGARKQGEMRVVEGVEACIKRNDDYVKIFKDQQSSKK